MLPILETPVLPPLLCWKVLSHLALVVVAPGQGSWLTSDTSFQVREALRPPVPPEPMCDQRDAGRPGRELGHQVGVWRGEGSQHSWSQLQCWLSRWRGIWISPGAWETVTGKLREEEAGASFPASQMAQAVLMSELFSALPRVIQSFFFCVCV